MDTTGPPPASALMARLRADLPRALKAGDKVTVAALRTALAAIANAEAPPAGPAPDSSVAPVVGRSTEVPRLRLSTADLEAVLRGEVADRRDAIDQLTRAGRRPEAERLQAENAVLRTYLA